MRTRNDMGLPAGLPLALVAGAGAALGALLLLRRAPGAGVVAGGIRIAAGRLLGPGTRTYTITQDDLLWLARCVVGEAGSSPSDQSGGAILWALAQNFLLVDRSTPLLSLAETARAYSHLLRQPTAAWCQSHPQLCDSTRAAIRQRLQTMAWSQVPATVRSLVERWAAGNVANPVPGMTDWASVPWAGGVLNIAGNIFGVSTGRRLVKAA
jgi:hypothetical protein